MRQPDMKTPPRGIGGAGGADVQMGSDGVDVIAHGATERYCYCRNGAICITCLGWSRRISRIDQRRAASLRKQAIGQRAAGGA